MKYLYTFSLRICILLCLYTSSRIFFFINNKITFTDVRLIEFVEGIRFDISALFYINIPLFILLLLPNNLRTNIYYQRITNYLFYIVNIPFIILNNIDIEYFKFTQKRSTTDLLQLLSLGDDAKNIIPQYIKDYWLITVFTIIQIHLILLVKKIPSKKFILNAKSIIYQSLIFISAILIFIIAVRGGLQLKPIKPINSGELTNSNHTSLILNTPFCFLHTLGKEKIESYYYFKENKINKIYSTIHTPNNKKLDKKNIVILIMESYSKEFIGHYNNEQNYTPFLDSLADYSIVFNNAFSNGLRSIEALPAITASIPTLMNNPFITSDFARNKFYSLASIFNNIGYNTSFFHGGVRGTMGFYSFSKRAGFQEYHGMEEYNNKLDFDGTWGIFDGPFFKYFANNLKAKEKPFFSTFFSLSSHPPYILPENYINDDKNDITKTIKYTDKSMSNFFHEIKKESWFKNTIFIITADHTSPVQYKRKYKNSIGRYAIPLFIFQGDSSLTGSNDNIVQQIDIMPTILDIINYQKPYFAFGKSVFSENNWAIQKLPNKYILITDKGIIINKKEQYLMYKDWRLTKEIKIHHEEKKLLQAIKQTYNHKMKKNYLTYENKIHN